MSSLRLLRASRAESLLEFKNRAEEGECSSGHDLHSDMNHYCRWENCSMKTLSLSSACFYEIVLKLI